MRVSEIRAVGVGELLARIDRLRRLLDAEGLFDPRLKRPIPFLPNMIGLITGRASAAERDVMTVAAARWPAVRFAVRNTAVQGPNAVAQIVEALRELDRDPDVDVIVVARGGGSVEDLLPFSDETLCRAIAACTHPGDQRGRSRARQPAVRSGRRPARRHPHRRGQEGGARHRRRAALIDDLRRRSAQALRNWVLREQRALTQLRSRPVLAEPLTALTARAEEIHRARSAVRRDITRLVAAETERVGHLARAAGHAGSGGHPGPRLRRGADVLRGPAAVLRRSSDAPAGTRLRVRVSDGAVTAVSEGLTDGH